MTSVSDAGGYWPRGHPEAWIRAAQEGTLSVRAHNAFYLFPDRPLAEQLETFTRLRERVAALPGDLLAFDHVKIYVDGILSLGTSALHAPYIGSALPAEQVGPEAVLSRGFLYFTPDALHAALRAVTAAGFRAHLHATGDRGVSLALDAIAQAQPDSDSTAQLTESTPLRHRITHCYLVAAADRPRFRALGVVADLQQSPDALEPAYLEAMRELIGPRAAGLLPVQGLRAAGAHVVLSSDWDAGPLAPLQTLARTLQRPQQRRLQLATALPWVTRDVAVALGEGGRTGSLAPGQLADLVVLDRNIVGQPAAALEAADVVQTWVGGRLVYDADD